MSDIDQMWMPSTPKPNPSSSKSAVFSSTTFFILLFVCLVAIAIPTVYFLPRLNNPTLTQNSSTSVDVPELLSNCAFFYQLCPTSNKGVVSLQTVDQLLTEQNSPLQQSGLLLYSEIDKEQSTMAPASQIVTLIGSKYNLNPFLLLTLAEMNTHLVTQNIELRPTIESAGEQSGNAWFSLQEQNIALELQKNAQAQQLAPNNLKEKSKVKSVKIGTHEVQLSGSFSLATQAVVEYLAAHSSSVEELQTKLTTFSETYQKLWGTDPSTSVTGK
jgi:hypothetical protein